MHRGVERAGGPGAGRARGARSRLPRHQDAGHGRPRGAADGSRRRTRRCRSSSSPATAPSAPRSRRPSSARSTSSRSRWRASACSSRSATRSTRRGCATRTARSSARSKRGTRWSARAPALRQVWDAIKRAAPTNATVLLLGESGAGKELVARSIHRNSLRSRERFVQVNCAAIPEELIESELFGHEKGSFTGATEKQIGKFEQADQRHHLPRRSRRHEPEDAGQGPARAAGGRSRAARIGADDQGRRAGHRRDQQGSRSGDREGHLPRGSVLPL